MKIKFKLSRVITQGFLLAGVLPAICINLFTYFALTPTLKGTATHQLAAVHLSNARELERYFSNITDQAMTKAENLIIAQSLVEFARAVEGIEAELGPGFDREKELRTNQLRSRYHELATRTQMIPEDAVSQFWPRSRTGLLLQSRYIGENLLPGGSRAKLDGNAKDGPYGAAHLRYHPLLRNCLLRSGFHDLLLIEPKEFRIVYSIQKELDFGLNLKTGPHAGKLLSEAVAQAMAQTTPGKVFFADFEPYPPTFNRPSGFVVVPVFMDGQKVGALALQLSVAPIEAITHNGERWQEIGLGMTGESFLVGPDHIFRSNIRLMLQDPKNSLDALRNRGVNEAVLAKIQYYHNATSYLPWTSPHVDEAVQGMRHAAEEMTDYLGRKVLTNHSPITLPGGQKWALFTTISLGDAYQSLFLIQWGIAIISVIIVLLLWFFSRRIGLGIVLRLQELSQTISLFLEQLRGRVSQQELTASQQASSVNETNVTLAELDSSARKTAEHAAETTTLAENSRDFVASGIGQLESLRNSMTDTKERVSQIANHILELSEQTDQIRDISRLVSDFANETKMLAMNAAVEAVRAGEHGKGFSVLALETRKLADESKWSTKRINALVGEIQKATNATVMITDEGSKTMTKGVEMAERSVVVLHEIAEAMETGLERTQQISLNAKQQSLAITQVVAAMNAINAGARDNEEGLAQVNAGIRSLDEAAAKLRAIL
ncbi:MAG: methyl-accepting chemotaxis protein [Magnetococcales bacterium]|nr:methyl-accepting chemotaxis protein [Magnetococcales bacterium]